MKFYVWLCVILLSVAGLFVSGSELYVRHVSKRAYGSSYSLWWS